MSTQSTNWVMDPFEVLEVEKSLNTLYGAWLKDRSVRVSASSDSKVAYINILVKNDTQSFYYPIEGRMDLSDVKGSQDACYMMLDYITAYLDEFFKEDENVFLPIDWTEFEVEGASFQLKGQVKNLLAEDLADQLLSGGSINSEMLEGMKLGQY